MSKGFNPALRVGFVLARHFTLSALALFIDTLRLAADEGDGSRPMRCSWSIMSATGLSVRSSCGVPVNPTSGLRPPGELDYIVLVGGLLHRGASLDAATQAYLRAAAQTPITLVGICTGGLLLCREGLMTGRSVCVSWFHHRDFRTEFPTLEVVADRLFVVDGNRITGSGGSGTADLAAFIVQRHLGTSVAQKCLHILQLGQARPPAAAQPLPPMELSGHDARVRRALLLMEQHVAAPLSIAAIATALTLSPRQLARLFEDALGTPPSSAYRRLRLAHAAWLLDHSDRSITSVALAAGFGDSSHFSRLFRVAFGRAPGAWRRRPEAAMSHSDSATGATMLVFAANRVDIDA